MTNREKITRYITKNNLQLNISCYNTKVMEQLKDSQLKRVMGNIEYQSDLKVIINKVSYIVQIDIVDVDGIYEVDFRPITLSEYNNMYDTWGSNR